MTTIFSNEKISIVLVVSEFNVKTAQNIKYGLEKILLNEIPGRILICGSFYMYKEIFKLLKK